MGPSCCITTFHQPSALHKLAYICQSYFLYSSHSFLPLLCPQVHSLYLHHYSSPANRIINTFFLDSIYMNQYICFSLSDLLNSVQQTLDSSISLEMTPNYSFYGWVLFHCIYVPQLLYLFTCWWTTRLVHVLAIVNSTAMNFGVHVSFSIMVFSGICLLVGHMIVFIPNFLRNLLLFSIEAVSIYIPTICLRRFPFPHILSRIYCL